MFFVLCNNKKDIPYLKVCNASSGSQCIHKLVRLSDGAGSKCPSTGKTKCELNVLLSRSVMFLMACILSSSLPVYRAAMMSLEKNNDERYEEEGAVLLMVNYQMTSLALTPRSLICATSSQ